MGIGTTPQYSGSGVQHFTLRMGDCSNYLLGNVDRLFFINDHDAAPNDAVSIFSNVRVYEDVSQQLNVASTSGTNSNVSNTTNGDLSTLAYMPAGGFMQFDLEGIPTVDLVRINQNFINPRTVNILVGGVLVASNVSTSPGGNQWVDIPIPPTAGGNVRIEASGGDSNFAEVEIFGGGGSSPLLSFDEFSLTGLEANTGDFDSDGVLSLSKWG